MTELNVELLEKTMQHLVDHPEEHVQDEVWIHDENPSCGTRACFVGWAQHFAGLTYRDYVKIDSSVYWAAVNLGLTFEQAHTIFSGSNTIPMLQLMVKDVINGTPMKSVDDYEIEASQ